MKSKSRLIYTAISASSGVVIGKVYKFYDNDVTPYNTKIHNNHKDKEIEYFYKIIEELKTNLNKIISTVDKVSADILTVHLTILSDPVLLEDVELQIKEKNYNASWSFYNSVNKYIDSFSEIEDEYLKERVVDLKDIRRSVLNRLMNKKDQTILSEKNSVIIAKYLAPSDMVHISTHDIVGFVDETGGGTSHSVIMARALNLPGVTGAKGLMEDTENGDDIIVDGNTGVIILNPNKKDIEKYQAIQDYFKKISNDFKSIKDLPAITTDGKKVSLLANIEIPIEIENAIDNGAEGIGLFRTEYMLFVKNNILSFEEQKSVYSYLMRRMSNQVVTIRNYDIGGDKSIPGFLGLSDKYNSFMGLRAIRILLKNRDFFKEQIKAILSSMENNYVRILLPFITDLWEVEKSLEIIEEVKQELRDDGVDLNEYNISVGIMVEVPSVAIMLEDFLKNFREIDFISIGTNDLTQFLLAVDRGNEKVNNLYNPYHPALLRIINSIVETAHKYGKSVEVCGEIANSQNLSVVLMGMGVDELSMAPFYIPYIKQVIRSISFELARDIVSNIMKIDNSIILENYVKNRLSKYTIKEFVNKRRTHDEKN